MNGDIVNRPAGGPAYQPPNQNYGAMPPPQQPMGPQAPMPVKKRGGFGKFLLVLLLLLAVAAGVYYWQHKKVSDLSSQVNDASKQISILQGQVASLQNQVNKAAATPAKSESDLITQAVKGSCEATSGNTSGDIKIVKVASPYASATYTCGPAKTGNPAKKAYLKKMTDQWIVVFTATGTTAATAKDLQPYGFPANFLQ